VPRVVVTHGGVDMDAGAAAVTALERAAVAAWTTETDELDAVVAGLAVLEDDPAFNAGYGSVLNADAEVEVDAGIVDGCTGRYGAVGAVPDVRYASRAALAVLRGGTVSLLSGRGAWAVVDEPARGGGDLRTPEQLEVWQSARAGGVGSRFTGRPVAPSTETVGCLLAASTHVVAGTSTGGLCGKPPGRIGDSAVLGAGLWADEAVGVLCSGDGESMIVLQLARSVAQQVADGATVDEAVRWGVAHASSRRGATCAVVAVTAAGEVAAAHNGASFPVVRYDGAAAALVPASGLERVPT
jgi:beta-aspartyl-peptidase (threonine type)